MKKQDTQRMYSFIYEYASIIYIYISLAADEARVSHVLSHVV